MKQECRDRKERESSESPTTLHASDHPAILLPSGYMKYPLPLWYYDVLLFLSEKIVQKRVQKDKIGLTHLLIQVIKVMPLFGWIPWSILSGC